MLRNLTQAEFQSIHPIYRAGGRVPATFDISFRRRMYYHVSSGLVSFDEIPKSETTLKFSRKKENLGGSRTSYGLTKFGSLCLLRYLDLECDLVISDGPFTLELLPKADNLPLLEDQECIPVWTKEEVTEEFIAHLMSQNIAIISANNALMSQNNAKGKKIFLCPVDAAAKTYANLKFG